MACLVVLAAALRVRALFTDFWLDEIWSYEEFARRARSVLDIFLNPAFKHDNNQHLNTLFMYLLGDHQSWVIYRVPALAAGLCTVAAATWFGSRRGRVEGWTFGLLVATSFLMVVYSTEARGYAWLLLFSLLAALALREYLRAPSLRSAIPFWTWTVLGLTAHSTIFHFYLGALLWSGYRLRRRTADLLRLHAVPLILAALWAGFVLWGSRVGGGPPWAWTEITDQSLAWTLGYPTGLVPAVIAAALAVALVIWDAWTLWGEGSDEGLLTLGVILGPPLLIAALDPPWLFPRYFLISLLFLLLVVGRSVSRLWKRGSWGRPVAVALLAAFVIGNLSHIVPFSEYGRGQASRAVQDLADLSGPGPITVTSLPVELRAQLPLRFYSDVLGLATRITYVPEQDLAPATRRDSTWVIATSLFPCTGPANRIALPSIGRFDLQRTYPAYGPSGICWSLYRRPDGPQQR